MPAATSARSRIMLSTSLPWYPTSVYLVASTLKNGAPTNWANLRAISVLPTPVGPIMMIFLGVTSLRISGANCCLRQRLRIATATAFLAAPCPTIYLSNSETICLGVQSDNFALSMKLRSKGLLMFRGFRPEYYDLCKCTYLLQFLAIFALLQWHPDCCWQ